MSTTATTIDGAPAALRCMACRRLVQHCTGEPTPTEGRSFCRGLCDDCHPETGRYRVLPAPGMQRPFRLTDSTTGALLSFHKTRDLAVAAAVRRNASRIKEQIHARR